jgi:hypothetical protein
LLACLSRKLAFAKKIPLAGQEEKEEEKQDYYLLVAR